MAMPNTFNIVIQNHEAGESAGTDRTYELVSLNPYPVYVQPLHGMPDLDPSLNFSIRRSAGNANTLMKIKASLPLTKVVDGETVRDGAAYAEVTIKASAGASRADREEIFERMYQILGANPAKGAFIKDSEPV
jgi:hypothetical protein